MLTEINCKYFSQKKIIFHAGLNAVLGDDNGANSIGKSTLLMIIDFVFGGKSFVEKNFDVITQFGHHEYSFCIEVDGIKNFYIRGTENIEAVWICDDQYGKKNSISIDDYTTSLKMLYGLDSYPLTFRAIVNLYSRIWGKENLDVRKPLDAAKKSSPSSEVDKLLKVFGYYPEIESLEKELNDLKKQYNPLNDAMRLKIVPAINKTQYTKNLEKINSFESELNEIKSELTKFAININEISNKEALELRIVKDELLKQKLPIEARLNRVRSNLKESRYLKSKSFNSLLNYLPSVDIQKISLVEEFHSEISKILKKELITADKELSNSLEQVNEELKIVDEKLSKVFNFENGPIKIIERVLELSTKLRTAQEENLLYDRKLKLKYETDQAKEKVTEKRLLILKKIEKSLNTEMGKTVICLYGEERKSPEITLTDTNYAFEVIDDTGTGKAYSSLIVFDLSMIKLVPIPFIIHDSVLFKNIENIVITRLLTLYSQDARQSFISIDEIPKYGETAVRILNESMVIQLNSTKLLFVKDWRSKT